jgi:hypothetical protein
MQSLQFKRLTSARSHRHPCLSLHKSLISQEVYYSSIEFPHDHGDALSPGPCDGVTSGNTLGA